MTKRRNSVELLIGKAQDFLDWEGRVHDVAGLQVFPTTWGGSFWHHDISDPQAVPQGGWTKKGGMPQDCFGIQPP